MKGIVDSVTMESGWLFIILVIMTNSANNLGLKKIVVFINQENFLITTSYLTLMAGVTFEESDSVFFPRGTTSRV